MQKPKFDEFMDHISFDVVCEPIGRLEVEGDDVCWFKPIHASNLHAIYRKDTNELISVSSKHYEPYSHKQCVLDLVRDVPDIELKKFHLSKKGAQLYAHFDTKFEYEVAPNDKVKAEIVMTNSYDKTLQRKLGLGMERLVCTNGMTVHETIVAVMKKHYRTREGATPFNAEFIKKISYFQDVVGPLLSNTINEIITLESSEEIINNLKTPAQKYKDAMCKVLWFDAQDLYTIWDVWNAITWVATHDIKSYMISRRVQEESWDVISRRINNKGEN